MVRHGLIASYTLTGRIGAKIAQKTKEMPIGWSYPDFLSNLYQHPSTFLLYDKLFIDKQQADDFLRSQKDETKRDAFKTIIDSKRFHKFDTESALQDEDIELMESYYHLTVHNHQFMEEVERLEQQKGKYANPSPLQFEAMNLNLLKLFRQKQREDGVSVDIIDEADKSSLYLTKSLIDIRELYKEEANRTIAEYLQQNTPSMATNAPFITLRNPDRFLKLWDDRLLVKYRAELNRIATKIERISINQDLDDVKGKLDLVKEEMHNRINEANNELYENGVKHVDVGLGFFSGAGSFLQTLRPLEGGILSGVAGTILPLRQLLDNFNREDYDWYKYAKKNKFK